MTPLTEDTPEVIQISEIIFTTKMHEIMNNTITESMANAIVLTCHHFGIDIDEAPKYITPSVIDSLAVEEGLIAKSSLAQLI